MCTMIFRPILASIVATAFSQDGPSLDEYKQNQADDAGDAKAKAAVKAKMAAVGKVITMMSDLQKQVLAEGETEAASYEKFACFCKDTTYEKEEAISKGEDDKYTLTSDIGSLNNRRGELDENIATLTTDIEDLDKEMKKATGERKETLAVYAANAADLTGALAALQGAIQVLKSSKNPSLVQLNSIANTVRTAATLADALGLESSNNIQHAVGFFLQQDPSVPMEDYKFHSDSVIETLENLQGAFRKEKQDLDKEEVSSVADYDAFMQEKTDMTKQKNLQLEDDKQKRDEAISDIAMASEELSTTAAELLDDKQYLSELAEMCSDKAKTWDQRTKLRSDELSAITSALTIIKTTVQEKTSAATVRFVQKGVSVRFAERVASSELAMEAIEAAAEDADSTVKAPASFLQRLVQRHQPTRDDGRQVVINLLKTSGVKLHSTLLTSLASQITADPFAKVKQLIQELIERLLTEAASEANQKGWCDKATADAKQKRAYSADKVEALNGEMAKLEALRNKLVEETAVLSEELGELNKKMKEATQMRNEEKIENEATVEEAGAGLEALNMAIDILDKFYKTAAKEEVDLGLLQGPADDAPDAGFDNGEAYTGAGGEAGGILGMLDVIKSDFERTVSETKKAEDKAVAEYNDFMTVSRKSEAEKTVANAEKTKQKDQAIEELEEATDSMQSQSIILNTAVTELLELKPTCIDTGMSYDERISRREDEIESLNKALCVLQNFQEFGPEGAANNC